MDIIETDEHRDILKLELELFELAEGLADFNKRYAVKCGILVVKGSQIICGNFKSFRSSTYNTETSFHPESTVLDMYSAELDGLTLYVAKRSLRGESYPSRPCVKCMKDILSVGEVKAIVYRDEKLRIVKEVLE
jgi:deoxycytidylate deaminase